MCSTYQIGHRTSSPHHPQSNGLAESSVKAMKKMIHCCYDTQKRGLDVEKWTRAMLLFRNTPRRPSGKSPAELLFGRTLRDGLPTKLEAYLPQHRDAVMRRQQAVETYRRRMAEIDVARKFEFGDFVLLQNPTTKRWDKKATVIDLPALREVIVETESGARYRRNHKFIKLLPRRDKPVQPKPPAETSAEATKPSGDEQRQSERIRAKLERFEDVRDLAETERRQNEKRGRKPSLKDNTRNLKPKTKRVRFAN